MLCKNVPVQKRWTRRPAKRRPALRGSRKSIRKSRDCAINRRAVRACPGVTFRRLRRFFFAFHTDIALRRMPVLLFSRRGKQRSAQSPLQPTISAAPTKRRAIAPRRRNRRGAFPCGAAAAAHPRGRFFTVGLWSGLKRQAAALRRGALRYGGAASAIWSGQAESG